MSKIKKIFTRLRESFSDFFKLPLFDISSEREEKIINKIANEISRFDMELPFFLMGGAFVPMTTIISQTIITPMAPLLELIGIDAYEIAAFLNKKENLKRLIAEIAKRKDAKENAQEGF